MTGKTIAVSSVAAVAAGLLAFFLAAPLQPLEEQATSLKYRIRGDLPADSSIVIVYLDNESVRSLGWPVRRNYYALMIATLSELGIDAVGIEVLFEQPGTEFPEYDELLADVIARAGNVVLPGYFRDVRMGEAGEWIGDEFRRPFSSLGDRAAGIGHLNLVGNIRIPLRVTGPDGAVAPFGSEVLRAAGRIPPGFLESGTSELNFPGRLSSFRTFPFVEVLRSFDAVRSGRGSTVPVETFRGKIVLVGVIAEGRSSFLSTPVDVRYPSIGLHAVVIDNILQDRFLQIADPLVPSGMAFLLAGVLMLMLVSGRSGVVWSTPALFLLVLLLSQVLFSAAAYLLPVTPILVPIGLVVLVGTWYRFRRSARTVTRLESEKETIGQLLHERETKLAALERELHTARANQSNARTEELHAEIRRHREEIRSLAARAEDLVPSKSEVEEQSVISFDGILGSNAGPVKGIVALIGKVAESDAPVLILGESGTGKELVARALHKRSNRAAAAFIAVNCGALSETLLESELFGHEKGAFTGAVREKAGRFELADGGTIFLDEIGEVTEGFQVKLLRVLQEGEFERVGGTTTLHVDVRVLAATNRDLKKQIADRRFREDLYYRLNVLSIELPPLRERQEDLPVLIDHFLKREGPGLSLSRIVLDTLKSYHWPGNIRELESALKRGALLARADGRLMVTMKDLSEEIRSAAESTTPLEEKILQSMREKQFSRRSVSETAEELGGLNRGTVAEYLRGEFLKAFLEHQFNLETTVGALAPSADDETTSRVRKRLTDYLANIAEAVDRSSSWDTGSEAIKPKMKNLPQQYHEAVVQTAAAFHRGDWQT